MTFWTRNKATLALTALIVLLGGGMYMSGAHCGSGCLISSLFTTNVAYAGGPGCSAEAKSACSATCDAKKTDATTAEAKTAEVTTASATDGKTCDKETCIAKCMAEKGLTRAEAEACWTKCQASGQSCGGSVNIIKTADAGEYSREAYIDACVAKGMDKTEAAKMADEKGLKSMNCPAAAKASTDGTAAGCCASKAKTATTTSTAAKGASN